MKRSVFTPIIIVIILIVVILVAGTFFGIWQRKDITVKEVPFMDDTSITPTTNPSVNWKTYESKDVGFLIRYPKNLTLSVKNNEIVLNHNIPYKNSGDCDMTGEPNEFSTLDDFNLTFSVTTNPNIPSYADTIKVGALDGKVALWGAEGCGDTYYYFKTPKNKTLFIKRANIQALSGISTLWDIEKILKVPGVISKEENERLFHQILSDFEFTN